MDRRFTAAIAIFFAVIIASLLWQSLRSPMPLLADDDAEPLEPSVECRGEPITVSFAYRGRVEEPHSCITKCAAGKKYYLLYTNGYATQCGEAPNCRDEGEDTGVTCAPASQ